MTATLLVAAHGTRSAPGLATTRSLVAEIAAARPAVPVRLCFLDVAGPSLPEALDGLRDAAVVVVPLLLSAGYHVLSDIPAVVAGRASVRVAGHLGPDPLVVEAVAERLDAVSRADARTTVLAAIASSRSSARDEVDAAAALLGRRLGRDVGVLALGGSVADAVGALPPPVDVAVYLLAGGGFLDTLRSVVAGRGAVAEPIGVHPALVSLVWSRYDAVAGAAGGATPPPVGARNGAGGVR